MNVSVEVKYVDHVYIQLSVYIYWRGWKSEAREWVTGSTWNTNDGLEVLEPGIEEG